MSSAKLVLTPMGLRWRDRRIPCTIGRGGVAAAKREGDGATPAGTHRITGTLYRPDRLSRPAPWARPIRPGDLWSDDPNDPAYNAPVRAPHGFGHESLRRSDRLYDLVLLTDWNSAPRLPGGGSAIFLHRWRRPGHPTAGCIAMAPQHLLWLARHLAPGSRLIVPATISH